MLAGGLRPPRVAAPWTWGENLALLIDTGTLLLLVLAGAGTGVLGALLGTGGGVFLVPILVLGLGLPMHHAVATSIVSVIATSSAVASANVQRGVANMPLGMTLEIATSLGAIAGGLTAAWVSPEVLEELFAVTLLPTAVMMWRRGAIRPVPLPAMQKTAPPNTTAVVDGASGTASRLGGQYHDTATRKDVAYCPQRMWAGMLIALVAGNLSGLLGIGGGVFKVPALHLVCAVPMKAATATSNFMIGVTATASAFLYFGRGEVRPTVTASVVLGVLLGSTAGYSLNRFVQGTFLRRLFAVLLLGVAVQMLARTLMER